MLPVIGNGGEGIGILLSALLELETEQRDENSLSSKDFIGCLICVCRQENTTPASAPEREARSEASGASGLGTVFCLQ